MKYAVRSFVVLLVIGYALFVAGGLTYYFALHDNPPERYRDIVVGGVSWTDSNKSSDFRYLFTFLALLAATTFASAGTIRLLLRKPAGSRWKEAICVAGLLGLFAGTAILLGLAGAWLWVSLGLCCCLAVALARRDVLGTDALPIAGLSITLLGTAFFAGLGIAAFLGRWLPPQPAMQKYLLALPVIVAGVAAVFILACLVLARGASNIRRLLEAGILAGQVGIPLCYSVFLPAHLRTPDGILTLASPPWLRLLLLLPIAGAWWQVWKIYSAWKHSSERSMPPLDSLLSTLCAGAVAVYFSIFYERVPYLSSDHFHIGEMLLPWQQFLHFHSVPYVNFAPVHGLMSYAYGFIASAFLDSTSGSFWEAQRFLFGIAVLITVWAARPLCGALLAVVCAIPGGLVLDRDMFLAAGVFLLVNPKTFSQPLKWLLTCVGVCAFSLAFNVPVGAAITVSASVPAAYVLVRWLRSERPKIGYGKLAILAAVVTLILVVAFPVIRGWIWFVTDNESTNVVANGMRFRPSLGDIPADGTFLNLLSSKASARALVREAWALVSIWGFFALFLQMRQPKANRKPEGFIAAWFIAVLPLALSVYTFVRIDNGIARGGPITIVLLATVLPVLMRRILPPFKPLPFLIAGYAVIVFFLPQHLFEDFKYIRYKSATLTDMMTYPPGQSLVAGINFGLPSIGRVSADTATLTEITRLKHALSLLLRPDETYLDLTNRQALFYYLDLPIPQLYVPYLAASEKMQERMIKQWRADPAPVVLLAPAEVFDGGPASLRCYRLYRELAFKYTPIEVDGFTFLVDPKRLPAPGYARPVRLGLLDSVFLAPDLRGLPSAWGKSWETLKPRFKKIAEAPLTPELNSGAAQAVSPAASFDLKSLALTGAEADFATVEFDLQAISGEPDPAITTSWTSADEPNPPKVNCAVHSSIVVLPLGAQPRWLLSDKLETFRIELVNPSSVRTFKIKRLTLWKLNDLKLDSSSVTGQDKFRPRFNRLRAWAIGPTDATQAELAKSVKELSTNMTFTLPSNTLSAAITPSLIKRPDGKYGLFAHAPAQVFLALEERRQTLSFGFGILPGAYTNGSKTDGVIFKLWLQKADGVKTLLWSRLLNPLEQAQDRDTQWWKIVLDPPKGARLILETDPNHNMYWDWAYWEDVRIE